MYSITSAMRIGEHQEVIFGPLMWYGYGVYAFRLYAISPNEMPVHDLTRLQSLFGKMKGWFPGESIGLKRASGLWRWMEPRIRVRSPIVFLPVTGAQLTDLRSTRSPCLRWNFQCVVKGQ